MAAQITATTQQSRFADTLSTVSDDVDLKQLTLTVGDKELLSDADLRLFAGVRYGLVGANGSGKTTLLRAIGQGLVVGFPANLVALYVDQLKTSTSASSVLDTVVDANKEVVQWRRQAALLQEGLDGEDEERLVRAVKQVKVEGMRARVAEAALTNELRSGARGWDARAELLQQEERLAAAEASMGRLASAEERRRAPQLAQELLADVLQSLSLADADAEEARARRILLGLGFSTALQDSPVTQLSGGWRVRAALAQALFLEPDLLLLDEPTNFLDLPSLLWLSRYLRSLDGKTVVVVSHDRAFLDEVAQEIILLKDGKLTYHSGNYTEFRRNTDEKRLHMQRMQDALAKKRTSAEKTIQGNIAAAKKTGDDKRLKQAASRQRKLDDRMGMERNEKGHRLKLNRDCAGYFLTSRQAIETEAAEEAPTWKLPDPAPLRTKGPLVQMEAVSFAYPAPPGGGSKRKPVLRDVTLCIEQGARLALVGANGKGKSTLVKLLTGDLAPSAGAVTRHAQARTAVFAQHQVEELVQARGEGTALGYMQSLFPEAKEQDLRKQLGSFGIKGSLATQRLQLLSGGQAVRVQLAAVAMRAPHLLLLDEPSSHLDMLSVDALQSCLQSFSGAVVLVSHDQHLVSSVAEQVFLVDDSTIRLLENGVSDYVKQLRRRLPKA